MKHTLSIPTAVILAAAVAAPAFAQDTALSKNKGQVKKAQTAATNSSMVAVDPVRRLAFVARQQLGGVSGDGLVDVINLKANPNKKNALKGTIDIGHADFPIGVAVDVADGTLLVVSGDNGHDGSLDGFVQKNLAHIGTYPFPAGSDTGVVGQVVFDPIRKVGIVATITTGKHEDGAPNATTGFAVFLGSSFGPIIPAASSDNFAFNSITNVAISPADFLDPPIDAVDITNSIGCTTDPGDTNLESQLDSDGAAFDPATNVVVVGDDDGSDATVMNLNGSTFVNEDTPPCTLLEGGTAPNSVKITTGFDDPAGVAVNPKTHRALLEETDGNGLALVQLPTKPVSQIDSSQAFEISEATLPNDPNDSPVEILSFPYSAAVDSKHNLGYADQNDAFLVQISLKALAKKPGAIGNALPSGSCKGTSTSLKCSNGAGVTFFPLSDTTTE